MDPDPDPAIFVSDLQVLSFICLLVFEGLFTSFLEDRKSKRGHKTVGINVFLTFCLMIDGSGAGSGSVYMTSGYGSGTPKHIWILRIRIRNTAT
jgi:hypothetical protein